MKNREGTDLTVVIPSWNRKELLATCLDSLKSQTCCPAVLVVDDGSTDGTAEMVRRRYPDWECLRLSRNRGFVRAVNAGVEKSRTPFVALLNNDTEADSGWVEAGLQAFDRHRDYSFFASKMINLRHRHRLDSAGDCYSRSGLPYKRGSGRPSSDYSREEQVLGASAGAAFYRRELFDAIGFFDEDYFNYLEDVEFSLRANLLGYRCLYLPNAVIYHIEAASDADRDRRRDSEETFYSSRRVFWITRNRWQLMLTYQPLRNAPWLVWGWSKSLLFHLLKAGYCGAFLKGLYNGVLQSSRALRKRTALKKKRRLSTEALCRLIRRC